MGLVYIIIMWGLCIAGTWTVACRAKLADEMAGWVTGGRSELRNWAADIEPYRDGEVLPVVEENT